MGLLDLASFKSQSRGYDYYKEHRAVVQEEDDHGVLHGMVHGSGQDYRVSVDLNHPRRSTCSCPFAEGRRVICKHMIALYFEAHPIAAESYYEEIMHGIEEEEEWQEHLEDVVESCLHKMKKSELENLAFDLLFSGPDWVLDHFIRDNLDVDY